MLAKTIPARHAEAVTQFSVFTPNRLGRLFDLVHLMAAHEVHVLGLSVLDTTDSAIVRVVVDDPERTRLLLQEHSLPFGENPVLAVELNAVTDLPRLMAALLEAEINIHYLYPLLTRPQGNPLLGLSVEDDDLAAEALRRQQFKILKQADLSR
jgi:hypothetical protein